MVSYGTLLRTALLFLAALFVLGCDTAKNCERFRNTQVQSINWPTLLERASKCLTSEELAILKRAKERYDRIGLRELFGVGKTVQDILNEDKNLAAYDATLLSLPASPNSQEQPAASQSKFGPWVIPESVFFVYTDLSTGEGEPVVHVPDATAFILCVPHQKGTDQKNDSRFVRFLITARHVLDPQWAHCSRKNPSSITVRLNKQTGGVGYETVPLEINHKRRFFTPDDDKADLAAIFLDQRLIPNLSTYKFIDVPYRILPTSSEIQALHASQDVMTAGLLPAFPGEQQNLPIFRTGILSNTPSEAVKVSCDKANESTALHVWFITATIPEGVSGAPVFTTINRGVGATKAPILVGVQSMAWPDKGVAGMTPSSVLADFIQDILQKAHFDVDLYRGPNEISCGVR